MNMAQRIDKLERRLDEIQLNEPKDPFTPKERIRFNELTQIQEKRFWTIDEIRERSRLMFKLKKAGCFSGGPTNYAEQLKEARKQRQKGA